MSKETERDVGIGLAYESLHMRALGLAGRLMEETTNTSLPDRGVSALGAIVMANLAIEAGINWAVERTLMPHLMGRRVHARVWLRRRAYDRVMQLRPPLNRLRALSELYRFDVDWKADPWASVGDLYELRNALVHYRSSPVRSSDPSITTFPNRDRLGPLAQRLGTLGIYEAGGTWLNVFLNETCARWAYETAKAVLEELESSEWRRVLVEILG